MSALDGFTLVLEEIWNIFTYYTLHGNPKDPSRLNVSQFSIFCKDSMLFDATMIEVPLNKAQAEVIFVAQARQLTASGSVERISGDRINFDAFLSCLILMAKQCYPSQPDEDSAMKQILMDNVLPFASRRLPESLKPILQNPEIVELWAYYEDALAGVFHYYSTESDMSANRAELIRKPRPLSKLDDVSMSSPFDDSRPSMKKSTMSRIDNPYKSQISYSDFIRFVNEFGLNINLKLTAIDVGDMYLSVIAMENFEPVLRKINLIEFWDLLVACSLLTLRDRHDLTVPDKLKAVLMLMWRHIEDTTRNNMIGTKAFYKRSDTSVHDKGTLLKICQKLNERFLAAWTKDGLQDYLAPNSSALAKAAAEAAANPDSVALQSSLSGASGLSVLGMLKSKDSTSASPHMKKSGRAPLFDFSQIGTKDYVADPRLTTSRLQALLQMRPELSEMLASALAENK